MLLCISVFFFFSSSEVQLPDKTACVGSQVSPLDPPITLTKNPTIEHTTKKLEKTDTRSSTFAPLYSPPDMDRVLYAQSYDEFVAKKAPVFPTSHCWTTHQSVYIGCRGGQLLLAEFESGVVKMVSNPEVLEVLKELTDIQATGFWFVFFSLASGGSTCSKGR